MTKEIKNGRSKLYTMNGVKLAKIFEKKGINARQFGKELNFHETYFPKCIRKNKISEKAIGFLMANGIMPSQYDVGDVFEKKDSEVVSSLKDISKNKCERCALRDKETSGPSDCQTCKRCNAEYDKTGCKIGATADTNEVEKSPASTSRADILDQAKKCVCGQREQDYGTPESNFQLIADLWNGYLFPSLQENKAVISPTDVSMMMALMKIARIRNGGGSGDSFVDLAGYAACGGEIWHGQKAKDQN